MSPQVNAKHQNAQPLMPAGDAYPAQAVNRSSSAIPADLAELALLDIKAVSALVGLKSSAIFGRVRAGTFPAPVRIGAKCTRWTAGSIKAWLLEQIAGNASSAGQAKRQAGAQAAA